MVSVGELASRASQFVLDPLRNPVASRRLIVGLVNDIPAAQFREDEAMRWAVAGFDFSIQDGEHSACVYGRAQNAALLRLGIAPIQRLPRDAGSLFGEALTLGARGAMLPYATTVGDVDDFLAHVTYPPKGVRGAYPPRDGLGELRPDLMAHDETQTQPWLQFETVELLEKRAEALAKLQRGVAFVGALDLKVRGEPFDHLLRDLYREATVPVGGIFTARDDPRDVAVEKIREAIHLGATVFVAPFFASDLPLVGAQTAIAPFLDAFASIR